MKDDNKQDADQDNIQTIASDIPSENVQEELVNEITIEEDTENSPDPDSELEPQDRIKRLRNQLKIALGDKQKYLDNWQREKADFINLRKRDEESKQDFVKFAEVQLIEELIPVLDSCREALKLGEKSGTDGENSSTASEWLKGIKSMYDKLLAVCQKRGLEEYGEVGERFDPNIHQSVSSETTDKKELDETIAVILQKGYRMRGKIIRPSLVSVYQV